MVHANYFPTNCREETMKRRALGLSLAWIVVVCSLCAAGLAQQQSDAASTNAAPRVVDYSGTLTDWNEIQ